MFMAAVLSSAITFDDGEPTLSDYKRVGDLFCNTLWSSNVFPALFVHQQQFVQLDKSNDNNINYNKYTIVSISL